MNLAGQPDPRLDADLRLMIAQTISRHTGRRFVVERCGEAGVLGVLPGLIGTAQAGLQR